MSFVTDGRGLDLMYMYMYNAGQTFCLDLFLLVLHKIGSSTLYYFVLLCKLPHMISNKMFRIHIRRISILEAKFREKSAH